ncbi:MAG: efflux RND transporter periplasmic adaptor subunit [Limnohabitans sp.]
MTRAWGVAAGVWLGLSGLVHAQSVLPPVRQGQAVRPPSESPAPMPAAPAAEAPPRMALERQEIRAQLLPQRYTTLAAEVGARIASLPLPEGSRFAQGQLLLAFDCSLQQAQLLKAQAEVAQAQATYRSNQRLAELNSVGQLELETSRAQLDRAQAEVQGQQTLLSKCEIKAPFDGRIAEQKAREQQFVQPGQPVLDILDDRVLELEFLVPSSWLVWLKVGHGLKVRIDETRKTYPARFVRIGARVDAVSQSIKVVAAIDGQYPELMAGMSGRIQVSPN